MTARTRRETFRRTYSGKVMGKIAAALIACLMVALPALAQEPIKIGVVAPFTGPFADYGKQFEAGVKAFQKVKGESVAGKKVQVVIKDTGGPSTEVAKRLAQELVAQEKVDFLAGFGLTPEALAVADVATPAKKPMVMFSAREEERRVVH